MELALRPVVDELEGSPARTHLVEKGTKHERVGKVDDGGAGQGAHGRANVESSEML